MKNRCVMKFLSCGLISLALSFTSCGGDGGSVSVGKSGTPSIREERSVSRRPPILTSLTISPTNPLGIKSGTHLQLIATGHYSDNSVQDITVLATWTSADPSVATVSNEPGSIGVATAASKGYCSISATFKGVSVSVVIGVN